MHKEKIDAKNRLENYLYSLQQSLNNDKLKDKFEKKDREILEIKTKELLLWIENNLDAEVNIYNEKLKELENIANPIMQKLYSPEKKTDAMGLD